MITPMTRIEIVCVSSKRAEIVNALQAKGLIHLEEVAIGPAKEAETPFLNRVKLDGADRDRLLSMEELERALNESIPLLTEPPNGDAIKTAISRLAGMSEDRWVERLRHSTGQLRDLTRKKSHIQDTLDVLHNYHHILETIIPSLGGGDAVLGKGTRAIVLTGDVDRVVKALQERLDAEFGKKCKFLYNHSGPDKVVGFLSFPEERGAEISAILGSQGVTPVDLSSADYQGQSITQVIARIETTIEDQRTALYETKKSLGAVSVEVGGDLVALKTVLSDRLAQLRVQEQFAQSQMVTVIQGWTPEDRFAELEAAIEKSYEGKVVVTRIDTGGHGHDRHRHAMPPTLLNNPSFFKPFEMLLGLFKPPTYGTIDPTVMIGVAFLLFYGFILGDVGYGIIIILLSRMFGAKWGHKHDAIKSAATIGTYMGVSGIIFGAIYGEYFGNFVEKWVFPELLGREFHLYLFHRAHDFNTLLVLALLFGIVHVPLGLILGIRESLRHHHTDHALEKLGMLMGLAALGIGACSYLGVPFLSLGFFMYIAGASFLVGAVLIFKAMGLMGLIGILEILSLSGNVLSYARLMALGVAGIAMADIANMLPGMLGYAIGIPAACAVHALNLGISIASPTIHSLRLNFVEFLPKFYSPEGKAFNPFRKETQW